MTGKNTIRKAIIPAAGLGTRMEPITKVIPKELLPLGRKPVLQYIIEELGAGGVENILIVTRSDKPAIRDYFKNWQGLEFVEENQARGSGYAVLMGKAFAGEDDCIVALGDSPIWEKTPGKLISGVMYTHIEHQATITMAIYQIPWHETHMRGIMDPVGEVTPGEVVQLKTMIEKPDRETAPSNWAGVGRYAFSPEIFTALESIVPGRKGEIGITDAIQSLANEGKPFYGYPLQEGQRRFDTGYYEGYVEAFRFFTQEI